MVPMLRKCFFVFVFFYALALVKAQDTLFLNLSQAHEIAVNNNQLIGIFGEKSRAAKASLNEMKSHFYPRVNINVSFAYNSNPDIQAKKGAFNHIYNDLIDIGWIDELLEEYLPLPPKDMVLVHGEEFFYKTSLSLYQPISQITTVNTGRKVSETDFLIALSEKEKIIAEITTGITELYFGILIEQKYSHAASALLEFKNFEYRDAKNAAEVGEILEIDVYALDAERHEIQQEIIQTWNKIESYKLKLKQLLNLNPETVISLTEDRLATVSFPALNDLLFEVTTKNPDIQIAQLTAEKAGLGVTAAKKDYIPELVYFAEYNLNHGVPLYPDSYFITGLNLKWVIVAAGERKAAVKRSEALRNEALLNFDYQKQTIRNQVENLYCESKYAEELISTAEKAYTARMEQVRLSENGFAQGEILKSKLLEAKADLKKSEADLFAAKANLIILKARLDQFLQ